MKKLDPKTEIRALRQKITEGADAACKKVRDAVTEHIGDTDELKRKVAENADSVSKKVKAAVTDRIGDTDEIKRKVAEQAEVVGQKVKTAASSDTANQVKQTISKGAEGARSIWKRVPRLAKLASFGVLMLVLAITIFSGHHKSGTLAVDVAPKQTAAHKTSSNPADWDWQKSSFSNGRMYLYTRYVYPGTLTGSDGKKQDAYLRICQDYEGFFFNVFNADGENLVNGTNNGLPLSCRLIWNEGESGEFTEEFLESWTPNTPIIRLTSSTRRMPGAGVMQNALAASSPVVLVMDLQSADCTFRFEIPNHTDYQAMLDVAGCYWYIPTYDNVLHTGKDVNPDMIQFLQRFREKAEAAYETAKNSNADFVSDELARMVKSGSDPELTFLFRQYQLLEEHTGGMRVVDVEPFYEVDNWLSTTLMVQSVQDGIRFGNQVVDTAQDFSPLVRGLFGDDAGDIYDDTLNIMDFVLDLVS